MNRVKAPREGAHSLKDMPPLAWILILAILFIISGKILFPLLGFLFWAGIFIVALALLYALFWFVSLFS